MTDSRGAARQIKNHSVRATECSVRNRTKIRRRELTSLPVTAIGSRCGDRDVSFLVAKFSVRSLFFSGNGTFSYTNGIVSFPCDYEYTGRANRNAIVVKSERAGLLLGARARPPDPGESREGLPSVGK